MIIVKLMGGMGNQMFQYAAARRLAIFHNTSLKLDTSWFVSDFAVKTVRKYSLDVFNIFGTIATPNEIKNLKVMNSNKMVIFLKNLFSSSAQNYIVEKHFHFDENILNAPDNVYLEGYWQSEKYFFDIMDTIRNDFTFRHPPNDDYFKLMHDIANINSVSLHVRRKDYVSNPDASQVHGTCSLEYYHSAIKRITDIVSRPHFYIFSDDQEWAKNNLMIPYQTTFVTHNVSDNDFEDLRLMTLCKYNIIANSSFSWWGAWLNKYPDKILIAPNKWFNDPSYNTQDLLPKSWITL